MDSEDNVGAEPGTLGAVVRCADCGRIVPRLEATEQTTYEGTKVRCLPCGDAAADRAWMHHDFHAPNTPIQRAATREENA